MSFPPLRAPTPRYLTSVKEPPALGQREVKGLPEVKLMLHREFKGVALLQNPEFVIFQTKGMPYTYLCALLYANTEH